MIYDQNLKNRSPASSGVTRGEGGAGRAQPRHTQFELTEFLYQNR
jgi:hypothetical protein